MPPLVGLCPLTIHLLVCCPLKKRLVLVSDYQLPAYIPPYVLKTTALPLSKSAFKQSSRSNRRPECRNNACRTKSCVRFTPGQWTGFIVSLIRCCVVQFSGMDGHQRIEWMWKNCRQTYDAAKAGLKTNYYGTKNVTEALLPLLQSSSDGRIVNVASSFGLLRVTDSH